jgi:hypothetical protein
MLRARRAAVILASARATKRAASAPRPPCGPLGPIAQPPESSEGDEVGEHASMVSPASFVHRSAWHAPEALPYVQAWPTAFPLHAEIASV